MASPEEYPLPRERNLILALLLLLSASAWAVIVWQASAQDVMGTGLTMGMSVSLFLMLWVVMMVAMMFPTAAPMILMFTRVYAGKRRQGQPFVPTWVFVGGYLIVWALFGSLAYIAAVGAERLAEQSAWLMENAGRLGGGLLVLAGLYQLSPLKRACLTQCRTPLGFIMTSWRDGWGGALRMGLEHGGYCLGCCWLLFVILFPLGVMNVAVMAVITLLIFAEKSLPIGPRVAQAAAIALIAGGTVVVLRPDVLAFLQPMAGSM